MKFILKLILLFPALAIAQFKFPYKTELQSGASEEAVYLNGYIPGSISARRVVPISTQCPINDTSKITIECSEPVRIEFYTGILQGENFFVRYTCGSQTQAATSRNFTGSFAYIEVSNQFLGVYYKLFVDC